MEQTTQILIQLIGNEVCGRKLSFSEDTLSDEQLIIDLFAKANEHDVIHLVTSSLHKNKLLPEGIAKDAYLVRLYSTVLQSEKMSGAFNSVCKVLEDNKIPYIPLKGAVLKKLYPQEWMRTSVDIDILVHGQDLSVAAKLITEALGYTQSVQTGHDVTLKSDDNVFIELHYRLVEEEHKMVSTAILDKVWDYASPCKEGSAEHALDYSFFYLYHIAHMAKHVVGGGCGIRPFLDLWLMRRERDYSDKTTLRLLKEGELLSFAEAAECLSRVWFSGEEHTDTTRLLQDYIVKGGMFGSRETRMLSNANKHGGKRKHILKRIFIPHKELAYSYPIIKKYRFLTPFCEICRLFSMLAGKKRKFRKAYLADLDNVSEEYADNISILFESIEL